MEAVLLCSRVVPRATIWNRTGNFRSVISTNTLNRKGSCVLPRCSISTPTVFNSDNPFLRSLVDKVRQLKVKPLNAVNWTWLFLALVYRSVSRGLRHLLHQANAFEQLVRKRLYRDYYARTHDPKWDVDTPLWSKVLFGVRVMVGHWLAAFEGPELHPFIRRYSEKVVVPTAVVQFGPYKWIMHPIYAFTILLFATYCNALRASLSLFLVACIPRNIPTTSSSEYSEEFSTKEVLGICSISTPTVFNSDNPFLSSLVDKVRQLKVKPLNAVNWTWLFLALVYGSVSRGLRHLLHQANAFEQLVRKRLYRDYYARTHDPKWDVDTPLWSKVLFGVGVMVGHWLATFEGPELHRLPGDILMMDYASDICFYDSSFRDVLQRSVVSCSGLFGVLRQEGKAGGRVMMESFGKSYLGYVNK
ncbi:hypothetical protein F2Q69_00000977, partial [Brassica cretica]